MCEARGAVVWLDWVQAAGFDAPAREDTLTGTRPGELIHAAFELPGFVDRGYQTADLKASGVIGISMRHLDSSTWHLDAASQGVGLVASPRVIPVCHSLVVAASGVGTDVGRIERELLASQAAVSKALVELVHAQQV